jgi:4'-phosphopantetheinyl transferase
VVKVVRPPERLPLAADEVHVWCFSETGKESVFQLLEFYAGTRACERTTRGKPYVQGSEVRFNLSHSGGLTVCAFCLGREIGIDVECENRKVDPLKLANRFFAADEVEAVRTGGRKVFMRLWTRKEAYVKALGKGIAGIGLDTFSAVPGEERVSGAALGGFRLWDLDFQPGYVGALAVQAD